MQDVCLEHGPENVVGGRGTNTTVKVLKEIETDPATIARTEYGTGPGVVGAGDHTATRTNSPFLQRREKQAWRSVRPQGRVGAGRRAAPSTAGQIFRPPLGPRGQRAQPARKCTNDTAPELASPPGAGSHCPALGPRARPRMQGCDAGGVCSALRLVGESRAE